MWLNKHMILITGAAGFIGSHFLELMIAQGESCIALDSMTYAADHEFYRQYQELFWVRDLADADSIDWLLKYHKITAIVNFAAETHVDNSIKNWRPFVASNITGTATLLEAAVANGVERFLHVSTDEVYGSIDEGSFTESTVYNPRNPYSATKAASDHLVNAWHHTYGLDTVVTNCSNNYGPRQHEEKLIPKTITQLLANDTVPVYGDGLQIRDWIYVEDHCRAVYTALKRGRSGGKYNIGSDTETANIDLVTTLCDLVDKPRTLIQHVTDRPGHDRRYSTDSQKIKCLGWRSLYTLEQGLAKTVDYYSRQRAE
jgi:dTDP-glucose 4,6-dehydratase